MRRLFLMGLLTAVACNAAPLLAHDDYRVVGTITRVQPKRLAVKTKEGKTFSMAIDEATLVSRERKKVSAAELKIGVSVVVDARGDTEKDLVALEVRIVAAGAATKR